MPDTLKLVNCREDLPKNFSLENYAGADLMDVSGWRRTLAGREFLQSLDLGPENASIIDTLFNDPLFKGPKFTMPWWVGISEKPVQHLTVNEFMECREDLHRRYKNEMVEAENLFTDILSDDDIEPLSASANKFMSMTVDSIYKDLNRAEGIYLAVDITCSDKQLLDEFIKVLTLARESKGITQQKQSYTQKDFTRWHKYGVLPFIDLTLWAKVNSVQITQHVMGEAILPKNYVGDITQAVRQTVMPLATKLLRHETITTLNAQIGKENG